MRCDWCQVEEDQPEDWLNIEGHWMCGLCKLAGRNHELVDGCAGIGEWVDAKLEDIEPTTLDKALEALRAL